MRDRQGETSTARTGPAERESSMMGHNQLNSSLARRWLIPLRMEHVRIKVRENIVEDIVDGRWRTRRHNVTISGNGEGGGG